MIENDPFAGALHNAGKMSNDALMQNMHPGKVMLAEDLPLEPRPIPLRCRLGFHRWPKWRAPEVVETVVGYVTATGEAIKGDRLVQSRVCPDCGLQGFIRVIAKDQL